MAGASGLVGQATVRRFLSLPEWEVMALSRRRTSGVDGARWISVDLSDPTATRRMLSGMDDVTHVVYAAVHEVPGLREGWCDPEVIQRNGVMLANLMDPLLEVAEIRHVTLLQGTKAYGLHHPSIGWSGVRNPLRESDPRLDHPNFYFVQEDYLRTKQEQGGWGLTVFRPTVIYGDTLGVNMNVIPVIGAWGALLRDQGRPLDFPGAQLSTMLEDAVDVDLVARAIAWAADNQESGGGTYNLTNGDQFLWQNVWPAIAEAMDMQVGDHRPVRLVEELPGRQEQWAKLAERHRLRGPADIVDFCGHNSLVYADLLLSGQDPPAGPVLHSTIAVRQAGFSDCMDTEDMFRKWFRLMRENRVLP